MTNEDLAVKITSVEERSKSNSHRLDEVERRQADSEKMLNSISLIAQRQETLADNQTRMEGDVKEIREDVKTIIQKPAKRWEDVVEKVILCVVAAVVAYALSKIGF